MVDLTEFKGISPYTDAEAAEALSKVAELPFIAKISQMVFPSETPDFLKNTRISLEGTFKYFNFISDLECELFVANFNVELFDLAIGKGRGLRSGTNKSRHACDVSYNVPALIRHGHLYQNISGKNLGLNDLLFALIVRDN